MTICHLCNCELADGKSQCPECKAWQVNRADVNQEDTVLLSDVTGDEYNRISSGFWDICFAEPPGIVTSGITLLGGMPGAGKSTFALQLAHAVVTSTGGECLYLPTEETPGQIRPRAIRLGLDNLDKIRFVRSVSSDTEHLEGIVKHYKPRILILDSIAGLSENTMVGVKVCMELKRIAQQNECPVICIDHITKADDFAGLMKLQHAVDTLIGLRLKEDESRIMFPIKNRFGPCDKLRAVHMDMGAKGLKLYEKKIKAKKRVKLHGPED